jgi:hypothetical protein
VIVHGDLRVDAGRHEVHVGDEEIGLAPKEFDLLWELLDHRGLVLTRDQLLERVWGYRSRGRARSTCTCASSSTSSATPRRSSRSGGGLQGLPAREAQKDTAGV